MDLFVCMTLQVKTILTNNEFYTFFIALEQVWVHRSCIERKAKCITFDQMCDELAFIFL